MANTYNLTKGDHTVTIVSNKVGQTRGNNRLVIKFLSIELAGEELTYWTGKFFKTGMFKIKLDLGKPYEHFFEGIKIRSNDQITFYIEM